jgi:hypothetical protein
LLDIRAIALWPVITVSEVAPVAHPKSRNEIDEELVLWLLLQGDSEEFKLRRLRATSNDGGKPAITCKAEIKTALREVVEPSVIQSLHPECVNRFNIVTFSTQCGDKFSREIFVEQNSHAD